MRKTSQDGGDSISATSGVETEMKKPKAGLLLEFKSKVTAKRTAPNLSEESDDAVVEPLLQNTKDNTITSAKYFEKEKADTLKEISKRFNDKKSQFASTSGFGTTESLLSEKDQAVSKPNANSNAPIHNHMNTNVFHSHGDSKANSTTKNQLLVEIDGSKQSGYNSSPLIFTTAKIHTDGKSKHMEPVQMTPAPILSTVEVSVSKGSNIATANERKLNNGTSVMTTLYSQPPANEKAKDDIVNISSTNVTSVIQINDDMIKNKTDLNKTLTTKPNTPSDIKESTAKTSNSNIISSEVQNKALNDKTNSNKFSIQSTLSKNVSEICSLPEMSKAMTVNAKNNAIKDTKDRKLFDEPRIIMSKSKIKSTASDNANASTLVSAAKPPVELTKALGAFTKEPEIDQSNKDKKYKSEKDSSNSDRDPNIKEMNIIDSKSAQNKSIKIPVVPKDSSSKPDSNTTTPSNLCKNIPDKVALKSEVTSISTSKTPESSTDPSPSAKTFSSSIKTASQSNVIDSKIRKEIDKSPKPSANQINASKISLNNTAILSNNKRPTTSIVKPARDVNSTKVLSVIDTSNENINDSSKISNSKAITSAVPTLPTSGTTTIPSSTIKTQSINTKIVTSTGNTKANFVTSTKASLKPSTSSVKSSSSSIPTIKQPNTSTAKTASAKAPSLAFTKTPQLNISSPNATAPASKPTVSKIGQVSSSNPAGNKGRSAVVSTVTSDASNKTKLSESDKKGGSKLSDHTKDP